MWVLVTWPRYKTNSFTEDITDTNIVNLLFVFLSRNFLYFAWRDEALWWGWCGVSSVQCVAVQQFCSAHVGGGERETLGGSVSVQHCLPRGQHCNALSLSSIRKISENICKHLWDLHWLSDFLWVYSETMRYWHWWREMKNEDLERERLFAWYWVIAVINLRQRLPRQ